MNIWANTVMTQKGLALQAKLIQGTALKITRAVTGTGYVTPGLLSQQIEVTGIRQELSFKPVSYPEAGKCALPMNLGNDDLTIGYMATQVGVYATDPDEGEILYFIAQAPSADKGTEIPSAVESPGYTAEWTFYVQYGQADKVTVMVDPEGAVSREEMELFIEGEFIAITYAEIDALANWAGGGTGGGDSGGTGGGVGTLDHSILYNRNIADQHSIEAITGLEDALATAEGEDLDTLYIEAAWAEAVADSGSSAGLYETGTTTLLYSWDQLLEDGVVNVADGVVTTNYASSANSSSDTLAGDLVLPSDGSVTSVGANAFRACAALTGVAIPGSVTSIGNHAFDSCFALQGVLLPDGLTSLGFSVFYHCTSLTSAVIPDGITTISNSTFNGCTALKSVVIPVSVTAIGIQAFKDCTSLTDVYYSGTEAQWAAVTIDSTYSGNTYLTSATIHYESDGS